MKIPGAVMILLGGVAVWYQFTLSRRRELALLRDLQVALGALESGIRWKQIPLPEAFRELSRRKISGKYFMQVLELMERNIPLQDAWEQVFSQMQPELSAILCHVDWSGDARQLQTTLRYISEEVSSLCRRRTELLRQQNKLCAAAAISVAGLLIIILV